MKKLSLGIASTFLFVTIAALAANFTDDQLQFGKPGSSANKEIVFGASNKKKLKHVPGTLTLDYEGNNLSVGDGLNTSDKTLKLNKGASSPTFRHNFTSGDLEIENAPVLNQKGNTLSVGDGTNTNKVLKFNKGASSPEIRYNSTTGKLQFTNDTTTYKDIGSGSGGGGGTNLLQEVNPDFESGTSNWTASGGTFIAETTTPLFGLQSGDWDSNASGQTLSSALVTIQRGFIGKKCTADLEYRWPTGVSGDLSFQVVNQVPNILATVALEPTTGSNIRKAFLAFDCPTTATDQLRARLISNVTNPAVIDIDDVFVGVNKSTTNVTQASVWARARWLPNPSCQWDAAGGGTILTHWTDFPADTDCNNPQVFGQAVVPATKVPRLGVANLPPGKYRLEAKGWHGNAGSNSIVWTTTDGTNDGGDRVFSISASGVYQGPILGFFEYTSAQSNVEFRVISQLTSGSGSGIIPNAENTQNETLYELVLYRYPVEAGEALNLETTGYYVEGNIGGANIVLGNSLISTYNEVTNGSLDLVVRTGSAPAGIACSSGNPSVVGSLTCSAGSETPGITFNVPYAGKYEVCSNGYMVATGTSQAVAGWQLYEVPNSGALTLIQAGGQKQMVHGMTGSTFDTGSAFSICGNFDFTSAGQKTIKLLRTQPSNTVTNFLLMADRDGSTGQRDIRFVVRAITQQFPAPVFTEITNGLKQRPNFPNTPTNPIKHIVGRFSSGCATLQAPGGWLSSATQAGTGICSFTLNGGVFSSPPICVCTAETTDGGGRRYCAFDTTVHTNTFVRTRLTNEAGTAIGDTVSLSCWGE